MDNPQLRETLEELHAELERTRSVDEESRQKLQHLMNDIQAILDTSGEVPAHHYESLGDRLRESLEHFEDSHPRLTLSIGKVLDNLAAIGL